MKSKIEICVMVCVSLLLVFVNVTASSPKAEPVEIYRDSLSDAEDEKLINRVKEEFGIALNELSFASFDDLWARNGEELDAVYAPLKDMLADEFINTEKGESSPNGVYYNETEAYLARYLKNDQLQLVHCKIGVEPTAAHTTSAPGERDEYGCFFNGKTYTLLSRDISG